MAATREREVMCRAAPGAGARRASGGGGIGGAAADAADAAPCRPAPPAAAAARRGACLIAAAAAVMSARRAAVVLRVCESGGRERRRCVRPCFSRRSLAVSCDARREERRSVRASRVSLHTGVEGASCFFFFFSCCTQRGRPLSRERGWQPCACCPPP
jgi:hypothetical protein